MQFKQLNKLQLLNKLLSFDIKNVQISADTYTSVHQPIALGLNGFASHFALEIIDYNCVDFSDYLGDVSCDEIDKNVVLALWENYLKQELDKVGGILDSNITVNDYFTEFDESTFTDSISFTYTKGDINIPLRLHFKSDDAINLTLEKINNLKKNQNEESSDDESSQSENKLDIPVSMHFILGKSLTSIKDLRSLDIGDGIAIDDCYLKNNQIKLLFDRFEAIGQVNNKQLQLLTDFVYQQDVQNIEKKILDGRRMIDNLENLNLEVSFELDNKNMSLDEIKDLKKDSIVELNNTDLSNISLLVNKQCLAKGRIVDIGNRFALQITEICNHE